MGFKAIHDQNPFIVPGIILSLLLILRGYFGTRPGPYRPFAQKFGRKSVIAITALLGICLVLAPAFEMYFRMLECRVSDQYMKENIDHAHKAMTVFQENNIPFWLDYATLLNQLRGQTLNAWEQDVDLSTIFPTHLQSMRNLPILPNGETMATLIDQAKKDPMGPYPALTVELLMAKLERAGFDVVFENKNDRMLIQCWGKQRKGPHIDVWLWAAIPPNSVGSPVPSASVWSHTAPPQLWSGEERLSYNPREFSHIFPLLNNATWLGRTVTIPQDSHEVSQREFGTYGGSYMTPQVFRGDCFHNFFQFRFLY